MNDPLPFNLRILKAFHAQKNRVRPLIAEAGLSPGQPKILEFLEARGPSLQRELAAFCDLDPATISKLLDSMEAAGLVERTEHDGDRRATRVRITEKGLAACAEVKRKFDSVNELSLRGFTQEERMKFEEFLERMHENLTGSKLRF